MKRAEMRIVGLNPNIGTKPNTIYVQRKTGKGDNPWTQTIMTFEQFFEMMQAEFPEYYEQCDTNKSDYEKANFFYEYGYDDGETFIFS